MLAITTDPPPLYLDADGETVRVGRSRVTLDVLLEAFALDDSPETIVSEFDTLDLADVYTVIGYYLRHRAEVDAYLEQRQQKADELRRQMEAKFPREGLRERLLARRAASKPAP